MPFISASKLNTNNEDGFVSASDILINKMKKDQEGDTGLGGFATGVGKGVLSTIKGAGQIGEKIGNKILKPFGIQPSTTYSEESITQKADEGNKLAQVFSEDNLRAKGTAEKIGKTTEQIAEFFIPAGKINQVEKLLAGGAKTATYEKLLPLIGEKGAKILAKSAEIGTQSTIRAIEGGGVVAIQTGGDSEDTTTGAVIGAVTPVVSPILRATGRVISKTGSEAVEAVIPKTEKEAKILQSYKANKPFIERIGDILGGTEKYPKTAGKTTVEKGLFGTKSSIGVQAKRAGKELWDNIISPRLKENPNKVNLGEFFSGVQDDIIKNNPEISRQKSLLNALEAVADDYKDVPEVSLEELQKLKEGWAEFVPDKAYKGESISGAFNAVRNELAGKARTNIYEQLGDDVKQAYFDYTNLKGLQDMGVKSMTGSKLKGGAGSFIQEVASQAVTPIATIGGNILYRLGNGIEFIGKIGAKTVGEALDLKTQRAGTPTVSNIIPSIKQAKASGQSFDEWVKGQEAPKGDSVRLYRGMTQKFDEGFDLAKTDAPTGYSTWTDSKKLAEQYAGKNGFVYEIDLPKKQQGKDLIDETGDRVLFIDNEKKAGLNNVSGKEYLIYNDHDLYNPSLVRESKTRSQLKAEWDKLQNNTEGGFSKIGLVTAGAGLSISALELSKMLKKKEPIPEEFDKPIEISNRGITVKPSELQLLTKIIFSEMSNRSQDKRELEARVIANTALNRIPQSKKSLEEVLRQKNAYQGISNKEFKKIEEGKLNALDKKKLAVAQKIVDEIASGNFEDNTENSVFYVHNKDGSITYRKGKLYK